MLKYYLFCSSILLLAIACRTDEPAPSSDAPILTAQLLCRPQSGSEEIPEAAVFLLVADMKIKLGTALNCDTISPSDYGNYDIPASAIAACGGWWAGAGDYFYLTREGNKILAFQGSIYEEKTTPGYDYHLIGTFADGKFSFAGLNNLSDLAGWYTFRSDGSSQALWLDLQDTILNGSLFVTENTLPEPQGLPDFLKNQEPDLRALLKAALPAGSIQSKELGPGSVVINSQGVSLVFPERKDKNNRPLQLIKEL